jgi:hypothetical protein
MKQINFQKRSIHALLWLMIIFGGPAISCSSLKGSPTLPSSSTPIIDAPAKSQDYSDVQLSDNGLFKVSYTVSTGTIPVNQIHQWTLHVETADGLPAEVATITVDGDMPEHGHGLPTRPRVTQYLGDGNYLVEGMKFQMGGWWIMDFTITTSDQTDTVHFEVQLK